MPTRMTSDFHARGIDLYGGAFFHSLSFLDFFSGTLPHLPRTCELGLRHFHLAPSEIPDSFSVGLLHGCESDLLRRLPLESVDAVAHEERLGTDADGELEVEGGGGVGGSGGYGGAEAEERGFGAGWREKVEFSVDLVFHGRKQKETVLIV